VRLRSDELDAVCERLIEAALELEPDFAAREQLHARLREVAAALQRDFQSDARRPRIARRQGRHTPLVTIDQADGRRSEPPAPTPTKPRPVVAPAALSALDNAQVKSAPNGPKVDKVDTPAGPTEATTNPQPTTEQSITPTLWRTA
jgi:hypothetical protein